MVIRKVTFNSLHWQKNVGGGAPLEVPAEQSRAGARATIRREGIGYRKATCRRQRQPPPALNAFVALPLCLQITYCCNSAAPPFAAALLYFQPPCLHFSPSLFLSCSSPTYPLCSSLPAHLRSRLAFLTCQLADRPVFTPKLGHSKLRRTPQSALAWFHLRRWTTQLR